MIRTSQHILRFANDSKLQQLEKVFDDYKLELQYIIDNVLKTQTKVSKFIDDSLLSNRIKHSQWRQIILKNASEIIKSAKTHEEKRLYNRYKKVYAYFKSNGRQSKFTSKRFKELNLKPIIKRIKIDIKNISPVIDSRLLNFDQSFQNSFDEFIGVRLPYFQENKKRAIQINLPIKYHEHSLKYNSWNRKKSVQLKRINNNFYLTFFYEKSEQSKKSTNQNLAIDIGYNKLISDSNGNHYGRELKQIYDGLAKKKRGSKNYKQLNVFRKNKTNQITNKFIAQNSNIDRLFVEDLKSVKHKSKFSKSFNNKLQYWSYNQVLRKLQFASEEQGFKLEKVSPAYTSQTCSSCNHQDKNSRLGEKFKCTGCSVEFDADTNAAINILHRGAYSLSNEQQLG